MAAPRSRAHAVAVRVKHSLFEELQTLRASDAELARLLMSESGIEECSSMITAEMKVFATGSRFDEVLRTLRWLMGQLEGRSGLEQIDLYRGVDREEEVVLVQRWSNKEDLVRYVQSDEFVRLLAVLDLSEEPPEIHFDTVSKRQGLEFVEALLPKESVDISE